ncbi:unnamed protein product, partial [Prunus brigantina]
VARSSTEAEYRSLTSTATELSWIAKLFADIGYKLPSLPVLWCDIISAIALSNNPMFHSRTKHFELDFHYIREQVLNQKLTVKYVCSQDQIADIHTKSLSKQRFLFLMSKLSLQSPPFSLRGCKETSLQEVKQVKVS